MPGGPLVAITASRIPVERVAGARWGVCATNDTYLSALRAAGLRPVLIAVGEPIEDPEALVAPFAGVVLPGGGDVDPACYGATPHPKVYGVDGARDALEFALLAGARAGRVPVLAICRGLQVANVEAGGDLIQHLPDRESPVVHGARAGDPAPSHGVTVEGGSRLAAAVGSNSVHAAVSLHHQAAGRLGRGLVVTGRSPDGVIEAVEAPADDPWWLLAVQWHPEVSAACDPVQAKLFAAFARQVTQFSALG